MSRDLIHPLFVLLLLVSNPTAPTFSASQFSSPESQQRPSSREIPAADPSATPDEAAWWEQLRTAANEVRSKRDNKKVVEEFRELLLKGQQQNYRVPVPDRRATSLRRFEPQYTDSARRNWIRGEVIMKVEFRFDGFIGEVETLKSLRDDLDRNSVEAARRTVFLPAVKDGKFVTSRGQIEMSFNLY